MSDARAAEPVTRLHARPKTVFNFFKASRCFNGNGAVA